jgi:hypothetical protein
MNFFIIYDEVAETSSYLRLNFSDARGLNAPSQEKEKTFSNV